MTSHMKDRFEDRLLSALREELGSRTATAPAHRFPRRHAGRRRFAAVAAVAGMVALAVVIPMLLPSGSAAWAVEAGPGSVRVTINHLSQADELERRLIEAGIPTQVDYLEPGTRCREPRYRVGGDAFRSVGFDGRSDGSLAFTLDREDFTGDRSLVIVTVGPPSGPPVSGQTEVFVAIASGEVQPCQPVSSSSPEDH